MSTTNYLRELYESEVRYNTQMKTALDYYAYPMINNDTYISNEMTNTLFYSYEDVMECSNHFVETLKAHITDQNFELITGKFFIENTGRFLAFNDYFRNSLNRQMVLSIIDEDQSKLNYLKQLQMEAKETGIELQPLGSYLILPIQRLPRYQMLLIQIVNTIKDQVVPLKKEILTSRNNLSLFEIRKKLESSGRFTMTHETQQKLKNSTSFTYGEKMSPLFRNNSEQRQKLAGYKLATSKSLILKRAELAKTEIPAHFNKVEDLSQFQQMGECHSNKDCTGSPPTQQEAVPVLFRPAKREIATRDLLAQNAQCRDNDFSMKQKTAAEKEEILAVYHDAVQIICSKSSECNEIIRDEEQKQKELEQQTKMFEKYVVEFLVTAEKLSLVEQVVLLQNESRYDGWFVLTSIKLFVDTIQFPRQLIELKNIHIQQDDNQTLTLFDNVNTITVQFNDTSSVLNTINEKIGNLMKNKSTSLFSNFWSFFA
ncbi:hypothetical protein EIN_173750 [Entamoeba invadens IP1]|uniref:DH domain-containing protein n=1 Tax=Entamoeba invadens IP1 TaxID=370355 RepID=A0A0A1TYQ5_ENTIV|nr:hypothetical protein EIN_173750 [Entamoeba invadens IP1]ELP84700.1 hypothetical protein EIN_173750 [Entamoeba invadens IP1]|eukprot:XP_004184046.1 hypothetical protein EIN_173750 [Entamoeba invadens IP1]